MNLHKASNVGDRSSSLVVVYSMQNFVPEMSE